MESLTSHTGHEFNSEGLASAVLRHNPVDVAYGKCFAGIEGGNINNQLQFPLTTAARFLTVH